MKVDLTKIKFVHALSAFIVAAGFSYFLLYALSLNKEQRQDCKEINIAVIGLMGTVTGFWVGSSNGSSKKDEVIQQAMNNQAQPNVKVENAENMNVAGAGGPV